MMTPKFHNGFSIAASVIVLASVSWGVWLVGSPATARLLRFDEQRLADLRTIKREIQLLCQDPDLKDQLKRDLPQTLGELAQLARAERINLSDPETGAPYEYTVKDGTTYELCATFSLARDSDVDVFWNHDQGRQCFSVNALDPP